MSHITTSDVTTIARWYADTTDRGRKADAYVNARAGAFLFIMVNDGIEDPSTGETATVSGRKGAEMLGMPKSQGARAMNVGRVLVATGTILPAKPATTSDDYAAVSRLWIHANAQGTGAVSAETWKALAESVVGASLTDAADMLDAIMAEGAEEREAEAEAKAEERKAERQARKDAEEYAATPAGKVAALLALAANLQTIAAVGALTVEEWSLVVDCGHMLTALPFVEAPEDLGAVEDVEDAA